MTGRPVAPRDFPTNRGGLCQKGWTARGGADRAGPAHHAAGPRRDGELGRRPGRRRWASSPAGVHARPGRARPRRGRGVRRRRADQREGLPARQVRPGRAAAPGTSTTTAGSACRSAAAAGNRAFGIDRGLPFPVDGHRPGAGACCCSAATSPTRCRRFVQHLAGRPARGRAGRRRPARLRDRRADRRRRRACTCSRCRAPTSPLLLGLLHLVVARGLDRRGVPRPAHDRLGRRAPLGRRLVAGAGGRRRPACPRPTCARPPALLADAVAVTAAAAGAMVLTGRGVGAARRRHRHGDRGDQPRPRARPARPAGVRATAASPARATGRAAASTARRPTSSPATGSSTTPAARRARRRACGASTPESLPGQGRARGRAARQARRARSRALIVHGSNPVVSAPDADRRPPPARPPRPAGGLRLRAERDRRCSPTSSCRSPSGPRRRAR